MTGFSARIAVLLATYQGARYLQAQLDSLAGQRHGDWRLIASDDGSTDGTRDILQRFAADHPNREVTLVHGPRAGATQNFLRLISHLREGEALAYCDQDDVWLPERLALGAEAIAAEEAGGKPGNPAVAAGASWLSPRADAQSAVERALTGSAPETGTITEKGVVRGTSEAGDPGPAGNSLAGGGHRVMDGSKPSAVAGDRMTAAGLSVASPAGRDLFADDTRHPSGSVRDGGTANPVPHPSPASALRLPAPLPAARPVLHVTRTIICDEALNELREAPLYRRPAGFLNALVQACTPGNATLVNPAGAALLKAAAPAAATAGIVSHDWGSYQIVSGAGGVVLRDPRQTVLYRQHRGNVMGRNDTPRAMLARLARLGAGDYGDWLRANIAALEGAAPLLTAANRERLSRFAAAIEAPGPLAAARLAQLGVYRQTRGGTLALLAAAAAGRLGSSGRRPS